MLDFKLKIKTAVLEISVELRAELAHFENSLGAGTDDRTL
jgi:hypothetical protein